MSHSFYSAEIKEFLQVDTHSILGRIQEASPFDVTVEQANSWAEEITILKNQLAGMDSGSILFEYSIPRMGKRADVVVLFRGIAFILEFKVGDREYKKTTIIQVLDYALDIKNFQAKCTDLIIAPIAVPTEAPAQRNEIKKYPDGILFPLNANSNSIHRLIEQVVQAFPNEVNITLDEWENSQYMPSPTIIEAAQALYNNHQVKDISRSDAGVKNLTDTTDAVEKIIDESRINKKKSIIFITGVPGAGKTLVGLNFASKFHNNKEGEHAVFLSGNLPLVKVLQTALARDCVAQKRAESVAEALREVKSFVQMIHNYRDYFVQNENKPTERITIFDEAQRCWTREYLCSFMKKKKHIDNFDESEPEYLISTMDRFDSNDWAVIICLVGGGQEINRGEAGMPEWFNALRLRFNNWDIYTAKNIDDEEYLRGNTWESLTQGLNVYINNNLYLSSSMRSFRSEYVSLFVKQLLDNMPEKAIATYAKLKDKYPIVLTRDVEKAKKWVREKCRGSERCAILSSSAAKRLRPAGVYYSKNEIAPEKWFLNSREDLRSSSFLEVVASEFETQGLEIDYAIVAWDLDFKLRNGRWEACQINMKKDPPDWSPIKNEDEIIFLKNAYRVLLTRARQGFIIFIPIGSDDDVTRRRKDYDEIFDYFCSIGIPFI